MHNLVRLTLLAMLAIVATGQLAGAFENFERGRPPYNRPDPGPGPRPGSYYCEAVHDAYNGTYDYTVPARVSSRQECIRHCRNVIVWEDQDGWRYQRWHMCWFDDGYWKGWIYP